MGEKRWSFSTWTRWCDGSTLNASAIKDWHIVKGDSTTRQYLIEITITLHDAKGVLFDNEWQKDWKRYTPFKEAKNEKGTIVVTGIFGHRCSCKVNADFSRGLRCAYLGRVVFHYPFQGDVQWYASSAKQGRWCGESVWRYSKGVAIRYRFNVDVAAVAITADRSPEGTKEILWSRSSSTRRESECVVGCTLCTASIDPQPRRFAPLASAGSQ